MTGNEILAWGEKALFESDIIDYKIDAWYILEYVTGFSRAEFFLRSEDDVDIDKADLYRQLIHKRQKHIPLQYLTGTQEFMGISFEVNSDVLIPRQDTECVVEEVLMYCEGARVLDLCTGSGCIGISVDILGDCLQVDGVDISDAALAVAKRNAKRLGSGIRLWKSDMFENVTEKYDIIVSNPPYIPSAEIDGLMAEVSGHEPIEALDGGADGLSFYRNIIDKSPHYLKNGGRIFLEIGCCQGCDVKKLLEGHAFTDIEIKKDLAGNDRVVSGRIKEFNG